MKEIKKFVDIELLRDKDVLLNGLITRARNDLAFKKNSLISITTKIDGSNFSVIYDPDENNLACFSRRLPLTGIDGLNGACWKKKKKKKNYTDVNWLIPKSVDISVNRDTYSSVTKVVNNSTSDVKLYVIMFDDGGY